MGDQNRSILPYKWSFTRFDAWTIIEQVSDPKEADTNTAIRYLKDGQWVDLDASIENHSDDPEINRLWNLPMSEFEEILDDGQHPLHDKAKQVDEESREAIRSAFKSGNLSVVRRLPAYNFVSNINPLNTVFQSGYFEHYRARTVGFFASMQGALQRVRPPNWPVGMDFNSAVKVIQDEGLPLVWVPQTFIVEQMLAAPDRITRINILLDHQELLVADCHEVLTAVDHDSLSGPLILAKKALEAYADGHIEAAQALAVLATETVVARSIGDNYKTVKKDISVDLTKVSYSSLRVYAALAPIRLFYTPWKPQWGDPAPEELSRHMTVHQADPGHYTPGNAVVAILLATSVFRALQEFHERADAIREQRNSSTDEVGIIAENGKIVR